MSGERLTDKLDNPCRRALQACWDEYHDLMPDALYEQVKAALGIRVFDARVGDHSDGDPHA